MNKTDFRARLKATTTTLSTLGKGITSANQSYVFGAKGDNSNVLQPLYNTGGVIFPYTPTVNYQSSANYDPYEFTHTNYVQHSYTNSKPGDITLVGLFTASTDAEARYLLAVWKFFNSITKSQFGEQNPEKAGTPPSILYFDYLGAQMFSNVPVVVTSFLPILANTVDYVPVIINGDSSNVSYVPTEMSVTLTLAVQQNPYNTRRKFDLDAFRQGKLLGGGFI